METVDLTRTASPTGLRVQVDGLGDGGGWAVEDIGPRSQAVWSRAVAALDDLDEVLQAVRRQVDRARPQEATVEFGLALDGRGGILVFQGSGKVHLTVTLTWKPGAGDSGSDSGSDSDSDPGSGSDSDSR